MNKKQQLFFATKKDITEVITEFEGIVNVNYIKVGLFDDIKQNQLNSLTENVNLGITDFDDWALSESFLVYKKDYKINMRSVLQKNGSLKYAIDQIDNPATFIIRPGGIYKDNCIIAGYVGTISADSISNELYKLFTNRTKKYFKKIGVCFVGNEAESFMNEGWRLTQFVNGAREYDLKK